VKSIADLLGRMTRGLLDLGTASLATMMLVTVADVCLRGMFGMPIKGVVDMVEITMLLVVFLGLPEAFLRNEQIVVDVVDSLLPQPVLAVVKAVGAVLSMAFLSLLAFNLWRPLLDAYRFGDRKADFPVPLYPLIGIVLFSIVCSLIAMLLIAIRTAVSAVPQRPERAS
jgi:TRAP-type C4-dicarboxylate transport system permease small subunit